MSTDGAGGEAHWRERAEQLQTALESRVVIEQAKGTLAERIGLDVERAFYVLRAAARSERMRLRELAASVTAGAETPEPIVRTLARHPEYFRAASRDERVVRTKEFFRQLNDTLARTNGNADGGGRFFCECGNPLCNEELELTSADLAVLHEKPGFYAILPGHQIPEVETVVVENHSYAIVRKLRD